MQCKSWIYIAHCVKKNTCNALNANLDHGVAVERDSLNIQVCLVPNRKIFQQIKIVYIVHEEVPMSRVERHLERCPLV